ncbi:MAG TPA: hypothetical protein VME68_04110 [Acidobacteriaceae bacterium]|nr:hypothetical protein [Acidobacteriaceae bacterium]
MKPFRSLAAFFFLASAAVLPCWSQTGNCTQKDESTRPDCPRAVAFFDRFHHALASNDRQTVASLINYPLRVSLNRKSALIRTPAELLVHFDQVFDAGVRCEILNATDKSVSGNSNSFSIGDGAFWFDGIVPKGEDPDIHAPDYWTK